MWHNIRDKLANSNFALSHPINPSTTKSGDK